MLILTKNKQITAVLFEMRSLVWGCQMRLGVLDEDDVDLMYRAGCRWILFGIESGNEQFLRVFFYSHFFRKTLRKYNLK